MKAKKGQPLVSCSVMSRGILTKPTARSLTARFIMKKPLLLRNFRLSSIQQIKKFPAIVMVIISTKLTSCGTRKWSTFDPALPEIFTAASTVSFVIFRRILTAPINTKEKQNWKKKMLVPALHGQLKISIYTTSCPFVVGMVAFFSWRNNKIMISDPLAVTTHRKKLRAFKIAKY